jgi:hypothetical protein
LVSRVPGSFGGKVIWLKVSSKTLEIFAMLIEYEVGRNRL